jgi:hypothetical protein
MLLQISVVDGFTETLLSLQSVFVAKYPAGSVQALVVVAPA